MITTTTEQLTRRINAIRMELCHGDTNEFAARIGKSHQHVSALCSGKTKAGRSTLELLLHAFPTVRPEWLYVGTGPMLIDTPATEATQSALYADIAETLNHLSNLFAKLASCAK